MIWSMEFPYKVIIKVYGIIIVVGIPSDVRGVPHRPLRLHANAAQHTC